MKLDPDLKLDILEKQAQAVVQESNNESQASNSNTLNVGDKPGKIRKTNNRKNELNIVSLLIAVVKSWFSKSK